MSGALSNQSPWRRFRRTVGIASPAAGADWTMTVPAGSVYELLAVYGQLVTDANVAARSPRLVLTDGDVTYLSLPSFATQAASLTGRFAWVTDGRGYNLGNDQVVPVPHLFLMAGWTLAVSTAAIQAGDQWSALQALVVETQVRDGSVDLSAIPELRVEVVTGSID